MDGFAWYFGINQNNAIEAVQPQAEAALKHKKEQRPYEGQNIKVNIQFTTGSAEMASFTFYFEYLLLSKRWGYREKRKNRQSQRRYRLLAPQAEA